jgi:hypothetical protein
MKNKMQKFYFPSFIVLAVIIFITVWVFRNY